MNRKHLLVFIFLSLNLITFGQTPKVHTLADTLRGSITPERLWWDILRYDITVTPDYNSKTIQGINAISYKTVKEKNNTKMQIDLQEPLAIDSVIQSGKKLNFKKEGSVWYVETPKSKISTTHKIELFYSGKVHEAINAPWDGGWIWTKDEQGQPWMTVACQGLGASVWYPCKDHQSDEPNNGASLTMIVPSDLTAVANGRMEFKKENNDGTTTYKWAVVNPISNYCIIPYIGKYVNFKENYKGEKGNLDLNYWVLDYNLEKAKGYMPTEVHNMLKAFEYWMGPYPFYEDGYQLIETSHTGMEHQSAVSYGNYYKSGYRGRDLSGTGWGMKFDFIIIHESGHEWFGNNITTNDLADMWVHESFTNYSETLFVDYIFGEQAGNEYNFGIRKGIKNDTPIIPDYNVNAQGSGDMYPKGGNMLHAIRHGIDNDEQFRKVLRGLGKDFYHQTVSSKQVEDYMSKHLKFNYSKVFDQYLRTTEIPDFEFYFNADKTKVFYRYSNCVKGFDLPLTLKNKVAKMKIIPSDNWQSSTVTKDQQELFNVEAIQKMYYITPILINEVK